MSEDTQNLILGLFFAVIYTMTLTFVLKKFFTWIF